MTTTAVTLPDLFDHALLDAMLVQGFVRTQRHPSLPLVVCTTTPRRRSSPAPGTR